MRLLKDVDAKRLIGSLIGAAHDGCLAGVQDGGKNVDIIFSRRKGHETEVMSLEESERRLDTAIRQAWKELTGTRLEGDPVESVMEFER